MVDVSMGFEIRVEKCRSRNGVIVIICSHCKKLIQPANHSVGSSALAGYKWQRNYSNQHRELDSVIGAIVGFSWLMEKAVRCEQWTEQRLSLDR